MNKGRKIRRGEHIAREHSGCVVHDVIARPRCFSWFCARGARASTSHSVSATMWRRSRRCQPRRVKRQATVKARQDAHTQRPHLSGGSVARARQRKRARKAVEAALRHFHLLLRLRLRVRRGKAGGVDIHVYWDVGLGPARIRGRMWGRGRRSGMQRHPGDALIPLFSECGLDGSSSGTTPERICCVIMMLGPQYSKYRTERQGGKPPRKCGDA